MNKDTGTRILAQAVFYNIKDTTGKAPQPRNIVCWICVIGWATLIIMVGSTLVVGAPR